jgi:predicted aconitase
MRLTDIERSMLNGDQGELLSRLLADQIQVGEFFGAENFVEVSNAHFMGDPEVFGEMGLRLLTQLCESEMKVRIPTTRNASCVDFEHAGLLGQSPELVTAERDVRNCLSRLGVMTTNTCIGYQTVYQPVFGEHVAWGDTGTVAYANSVLGARTNYEGGTAALAAALTGRTPAYGFHLAGCRLANVKVRVEADMNDYADWGALGAIVGERTRGYWNVPAFEMAGSSRPHSDDLKHLGAALASFGSMAMYHVVGVTPEAPDMDAAIGGRELLDELTITSADIDAYMNSRNFTNNATDNVDLVVFTAPQLSLFELQKLAALLDEKQVAANTKVIVTTNSTSLAEAEEQGYAATIRNAGVDIFKGTCWYTMDPAAQRERFGWRRLVTNSAKLINIIQAHGFTPILRRTEDCIDAAVTGRLV